MFFDACWTLSLVMPGTFMAFPKAKLTPLFPQRLFRGNVIAGQVKQTHQLLVWRCYECELLTVCHRRSLLMNNLNHMPDCLSKQ